MVNTKFWVTLYLLGGFDFDCTVLSIADSVGIDITDITEADSINCLEDNSCFGILFQLASQRNSGITNLNCIGNKSCLQSFITDNIYSQYTDIDHDHDIDNNWFIINCKGEYSCSNSTIKSEKNGMHVFQTFF